MKLWHRHCRNHEARGYRDPLRLPVNHLIEHAPMPNPSVMVRQERIGLHMADAILPGHVGAHHWRLLHAARPGAENAMGRRGAMFRGIRAGAGAADGYARRLANIEPNFNSSQAMRAFAKSAEPINIAAEVCNIFRRAFTKLKNGRGGPVIVEIRPTCGTRRCRKPLNYTPVLRTRYGADPVHVKQAAALLMSAKRPVIYAGQGVHYAQAWPQLRRLAERLAISRHHQPRRQVVISGDAPLSLGSGGLAVPRAVPKFLGEADVIFGIGCSFTETCFGIAMPKGKTIIHSTSTPRTSTRMSKPGSGLSEMPGWCSTRFWKRSQQRQRRPRCVSRCRRDRRVA